MASDRDGDQQRYGKPGVSEYLLINTASDPETEINNAMEDLCQRILVDPNFYVRLFYEILMLAL